MNASELLHLATGVLSPRTVKGRVFGDVGAAILASSGKVYTGVSVDTPGWGLCAERSALAAMITSGEVVFQKAVAVWRNDSTGKLYVLPPCGSCREFMRAIDDQNLGASIILSEKHETPLQDLLPAHAWPNRCTRRRPDEGVPPPGRAQQNPLALASVCH